MPAVVVREELPRPALAGIDETAIEAAGRSGFIVPASQFGQCGCPGDCDRDHDNE
jgi:hypothetical protein